jgi:hypothetical protein
MTAPTILHVKLINIFVLLLYFFLLVITSDKTKKPNKPTMILKILTNMQVQNYSKMISFLW